MIHIFKTRNKTNEFQYLLFPRSIISLIFLILNTGNTQTQVELSVPSSLSLGKAPLTISCRSLKTSVINRIQIERKPATGSVYSTLVYVGEGFTPIVRDGKENGDSLLMEQMVLRQINSFLMLKIRFLLQNNEDVERSGFSSLSVFSNSSCCNSNFKTYLIC